MATSVNKGVTPYAMRTLGLLSMVLYLLPCADIMGQNRWKSSAQVDYGLAFFNQALPDYKESPKNNSVALYGVNWRVLGALEWDLARRRGWSGKMAGGFLGTYTNVGTLEGVEPTAKNVRLWTIPLHIGVRNYNFTDAEDPFRKRYIGFSAGVHYTQMNPFSEEEGNLELLDPKRRVDVAVQFEAGSIVSLSSHWFLDFGYSATVGTQLLAGRLKDPAGYEPLFRRAGAAQLFLFHLRIGYDSQKAKTGPEKRYFNLYQN